MIVTVHLLQYLMLVNTNTAVIVVSSSPLRNINWDSFRFNNVLVNVENNIK